MPNSGEPSIRSVTRHRARSGVGYSQDDVVLLQTSRRRILLRPWYIPHKTRSHALAGKLIVQTGTESAWHDETEVNLDEEAVGNLRRALDEHSAVAASGEEGSLLLLRGSAVETASEAEAADVAQALVKVLERRDVLRSFSREDLSGEILAALRASIRLQQLRHAVRELRELLESGAVEEKHYQDWCTAHTWAFGNAHTMADEIRRVTRTDDVDVLLPRVLTGYRDIVELKRPDHPVLIKDPSRNTWSWSREASKAIGQCHTYIDNLHLDAEGGLRGRPEIVAYHPRATIVIGRSGDWDAEAHRALAGLNQRLVGITLMTYDHLLAQGEELIRLFTAEDAAENAELG